MTETKKELQYFIGISLKKISYSLFILMFFIIGFNLGTMYFQHYLETQDTFWEWLDSKKECDNLQENIINTIIDYKDKNNYLDYSCTERIRDYKNIMFLVRIEVGLTFLIVLFDWLKKPEEHWATEIWREIKCISLK